MTEHLTDQHISIKKEMLRVLDDISSMYLYCYVFFERNQPPSNASTSAPMSLPDIEMDELDGDHRTSLKRDGPETRTVIIGQERKRQKTHFAISLEELHLRSLWWMLQRRIRVNWDPLCFYENMTVDKNEFLNTSSTAQGGWRKFQK